MSPILLLFTRHQYATNFPETGTPPCPTCFPGWAHHVTTTNDGKISANKTSRVHDFIPIPLESL